MFIIVIIPLSYLKEFQSQTAGIMTLKKNNEISIIMERADHKEVEIKTPKIISPLLVEGEEYYVIYKYTKLHSPRLIKIEYN